MALMFPNTTQSTPLLLPPPPPPPSSLPPLLFSDFQLPPPSLPPLPASDIQYGSTNNGDGHIWNNQSGTGNLLCSSMMNECTPSSTSSSSSSLLPPTNQNLQIMDSSTDMFTANGDEDVDWTQLDNLELPENWIQDTITCSELENFLKNLDY
ncbi:uncharacterized protein [Spinacia oleracea]|uniref:Uncharacterized protein n=1 Tax=Spinacia oleracea TaxID=3562 RepID=A0ABM3QLZ2_SPIOL|nr:uncharacterized protein LOC130460812 [Spinacia oleracea]